MTVARMTDRDFAAYVSKSVSYTPYPHQATVTLHAPVEAVAERLPPGAGTLEAMDNGACILHTGAFSLDSLSVYLALQSASISRYSHLQELIDRVRSLAERFSRATA